MPNEDQTIRVKGHIKWFSQGMRYGFIQRDDKLPDVFVHLNDFRDTVEALLLSQGDAVEFGIEQAPKGPRAVDVVTLKTA
jgi:CspA family cold shock protein